MNYGAKNTCPPPDLAMTVAIFEPSNHQHKINDNRQLSALDDQDFQHQYTEIFIHTETSSFRWELTSKLTP
jgi:hypothetical protein